MSARTERNIKAERFVVDATGTIQIEGDELRQRVAEHCGSYLLMRASPNLLVLRADPATDRTSPQSAASASQVWMAGELPTRTALLDIIGMVAQANWQGALHVWGPRYHRILSFAQGALKAAASDCPTERLGSQLISHGLLDQVQLDSALAETNDRRRLGQVLVENSLLGREQLFEQLRFQTEQIFYGAILERDATYAFVVPGDEPPHAISLHLPVQGLLMEGVQRIDEMALFRERIPSASLRPKRPDAPPEAPSDEVAQKLLQHVDGRRSILELASATGMDEYETTKAIYGLIQQGQLVLPVREAFDGDAVAELLEPFNDVLRLVFASLEPEDRGATHAAIERWIAAGGFTAYAGQKLESDGSLVPDVVLENLRQANLERPLQSLTQSLHDLVSYTLFAGTPQLPREKEQALIREVEAKLRAIRL